MSKDARRQGLGDPCLALEFEEEQRQEAIREGEED
jgi:hypothetical protein